MQLLICQTTKVLPSMKNAVLRGLPITKMWDINWGNGKQ